MAEPHDDAVIGFGGDGELAGQGFALNDERVIARGGERIGELAEDAFRVVVNAAGLAVEELGGANDFAAEGRADRLLANPVTEDYDLAVDGGVAR